MSARILIIEDNQANLELMTYLLKAFGHLCFSAMDGEEGIAMVRRERPDLIICDIQLPTLDGFEVARQLQADPALSSIPLVAVTALAMVGDRTRVLSGGFHGYIAKPINPETFVSQIEAFLDLKVIAGTRVGVAASAVSESPEGTNAEARMRDRMTEEGAPAEHQLANELRSRTYKVKHE